MLELGAESSSLIGTIQSFLGAIINVFMFAIYFKVMEFLKRYVWCSIQLDLERFFPLSFVSTATPFPYEQKYMIEYSHQPMRISRLPDSELSTL